MAAVDLINVSKQVGPNTILDTLNISIPTGEFVAVVGPSGCGKSTLLRLISGLDAISSGEIRINNQRVDQIPAAKRDMAMVFQSYALYPHMTVFDNMAYGLKLRRLSKEEILKRVNEAASLLQLTPYLDRKPQALSGGQRQRVAMGRAIVRSPSVFLFDEPLSNLDAKLRTEMRHEIRKLHQQFRTTSLYVTHDQTEAMTMAERVLVLNQGKVEQIGSPLILYQNPATLFVAGFTGHYPMNFAKARYNKDSQRITTELGISHYLPQDVCVKLEDKQDLVIAIRPEHIQPCSAKTEKSTALKIEFIDDMGADKLIQGISLLTGEKLYVRVASEFVIDGELLNLEFPVAKIHVFDKKQGFRIG